MKDFEEFKNKFLKVQEDFQPLFVSIILASGGYIFANGFAQSYGSDNNMVLLLHDRFIIAEIPISSIIDIKP